MATNYTYTTNIPLDTNTPAQDQPNMKTNTNSINSIIGTDHLTFGTATGSQIDGMHTLVRQVTGPGTQNLTRSGAGATYANQPTNISGINQLIAGVYTPNATVTSSDTQLFSLTGGNVISQLTGSNLTNTATSDGYAWIGGILLQWGFVSSLSQTASGTVTFKDRQTGMIPFPNNCFLINATLSVRNAATMSNIRTAQLVIFGGTVSTTGFNWAYNYDTSGISQGFYWFAVGN